MKTFAPNAMFLVVPLVMLIGVGIGVGVRPVVEQLAGIDRATHDDHDTEADPADDHDHPHDDDHGQPSHDEDQHVPLSRQAFNNLQLRIAPVELTTYTRTVRLPGEVVEAPGRSCRKLAAPVSGRIVHLYAAPGETVLEGDLIAEIEIIDDDLMQAQLRLLELQTKSEIVEAELSRLAPLSESGGVAGRRRLEYEYQQKEVAASLSRTRQELAMRGLSEEQVKEIMESGVTLKRLEVRAPALKHDAPPTRLAQRVELSTFEELVDNREELQVESLLAEVGQNLQRGDPICNLSAHALLMIRGHAYEKDVNLVTRLTGSQQPITAEFGAAGQGELVEGLRVQTVAGHADAGTQNFPFYVPLQNEKVGETTDATGRIFRLWRFKVGQRVHVLAPVEQIPAQLVLPRGAVVQETAEALVFREVHHADGHDHEAHGHDDDDDHDHGDHPHGEEDDHDHGDHNHGDEDDHGHDAHDHGAEEDPSHGEADEPYIEFEPVPVTIVAQDAKWVVVAPGELLEVGDEVATNNAYQLYLTLQAQTEGGGGHDHHH